MSENVIFHEKKHGVCGFIASKEIRVLLGKDYVERNYVEVDSEIMVTESKLIITPKVKNSKEIIIPINKIAHIEKKGEFESHKCDKKCFSWIFLQNGTKYRITFNGKSRNKLEKTYDMGLNNAFYGALRLPLRKVYQEKQRKKRGLLQKKEETKINWFRSKIKNYLAPYNEITFEKIAAYFDVNVILVEEELKKMIANNAIKGKLNSTGIVFEGQARAHQVQQSVVINATLPSGTTEVESRALICPQCKAPLNREPPCECEYCNFLINNSNKSSLNSLGNIIGILNQGDNNINNEKLDEVYEEVNEISNKLDKIDGKIEQLTVDMDANKLLEYLEQEKKSPEKILEKVIKNMKKNNFSEEEVLDFLTRLKTAIWKQTVWGKAFEKSWKEKIIHYLKVTAKSIFCTFWGSYWGSFYTTAANGIVNLLENKEKKEMVKEIINRAIE
ncbi:MAG: PCI domain-containing protein [Candidatus Hodarchaeota archaeon]